MFVDISFILHHPYTFQHHFTSTKPKSKGKPTFVQFNHGPQPLMQLFIMESIVIFL